MKSLRKLSIHCIAAIALIMPLLVSLSCGPRNALVQETLPAESAIADILHARAARVRSIYCDITVEPVGEALWKKLMNAETYRKPGPGLVFQRTPPVSAFLILLKNTVNAPIRLEKAQIIGAGTVMDALTADRLGTRLRSPAYSRCDFARMLSFRRVVGQQESLKRIDFDRDTIETRLDFIPPQDSVIAVIAFEQIPAGIRRFKLRFSIWAMGSGKEIGVEFTRHEYRGAGIEKGEARAEDDE